MGQLIDWMDGCVLYSVYACMALYEKKAAHAYGFTSEVKCMETRYVIYRLIHPFRKLDLLFVGWIQAHDRMTRQRGPGNRNV